MSLGHYTNWIFCWFWPMQASAWQICTKYSDKLHWIANGLNGYWSVLQYVYLFSFFELWRRLLLATWSLHLILLRFLHLPFHNRAQHRQQHWLPWHEEFLNRFLIRYLCCCLTWFLWKFLYLLFDMCHSVIIFNDIHLNDVPKHRSTRRVLYCPIVLFDCRLRFFVNLFDTFCFHGCHYQVVDHPN